MITLPLIFKDEVKKSISVNKIFKDSNVDLLDVTLRDGGFGVSFNWSPTFIQLFIEQSFKAGTSMIEVGYIGGVKSKTGWYDGFCADVSPDFIHTVTQKIPNAKIAVIINPWRINRQIDFNEYQNCGVSLIRIAYNPQYADITWPIIQQIQNHNLDICLNVTSVSRYENDKLELIIKEFYSKGIKAISFADTTSGLTPIIIRGFEKSLQFAISKGMKLGFHGHDALGFGNANAFEFIRHGISTVDISVGGIGRGGKNLTSETWLFLMLTHLIKKPEFDLLAIAKLSKLVSSEINFDIPDFLALVSAVFGISPEMYEGFSAQTKEEQLELNEQCCKLLESLI